FFKLAAFYLIYRSIFVIGIRNPFELIFRDLRQTQSELTQVKNSLQEQVEKRTGELQKTNEQLKSEINQREKMEAQTLLLGKIVQFSNDAIIGEDPEGIVLTWNQGAEQVFGYRSEEMVGKTVGMLIPPDRQHELSELLAKAKRGEKLAGLVTEWMHKNGQRLFVSLTLSTISDSNGQIVGISTIARDITRKLRAEEEVRRLNAELEQRVETRTLDLAAKRSELEDSRRALMNLVEDLHSKTDELEQANIRLQEIDHLKSMFIASMSHELRTPLNSIIGFSSILLHQWIGPISPEQQENLAIILRCGKHLLSLINDVIDVAKIEAGKIDPNPEPFELAALIAEAVELVKPKLEEKELELQLQSSDLSLYTDRRRLLQCVLNLLSNAVKYTEKGRVKLTAKVIPDSSVGSPAGMVEICVADTGIGIKQEDFPHLFQPFVRLEHTRSSAIPGTGLGLYLSQKLATEVLKGEITFTSEYGRGSRFTLRVKSRLP
ncbi:MAG: ATP-binding protein, partial [Desulfuromonadaceae bacterium]